MLTVYDYLMIRTAHAQGESIRSLAQRPGRAQKTIRKVIASETGEPERYIREGPVFCVFSVSLPDLIFHPRYLQS